MPITQRPGYFHPLPVIGHPEAFYAKHAKEAEAAGNTHARAAHKVGQYVTLGLDRNLPIDRKLRDFCHALSHYCTAPPDADESLKVFYGKLRDLVRRHAGQEALRLAREKHDEFRRRLAKGESRDSLTDEAELFFPKLLGHCHESPDWMSKEAWQQIRLLENQWV